MTTRTIHILGLGNIGCYMAVALRSLPPPTAPAVTVLLRPGTLPHFRHSVSLTSLASGSMLTATGFVAESSSPPGFPSPSQPPPIRHLIVATKSYQLRDALRPLLPRLSRSTTIVLMQNGIPVLPTDLFPGAGAIPRCFAAVTTHGIYSSATERFAVTLAGVGSVVVGPVSSPFSLGGGDGGGGGGDGRATEEEADWLLEQLARTGAEIVHTPGELQRRQRAKLAINAAINPLSALHGVRNGQLMGIPAAVDAMRAIVAELVAVTRPHHGGHGNPAEQDEEQGELWRAVKHVAHATRDNYSSMLQDVRAGRRTEVREINGWIAARGCQLGVPCPQNQRLVAEIEGLEARLHHAGVSSSPPPAG